LSSSALPFAIISSWSINRCNLDPSGVVRCGLRISISPRRVDAGDFYVSCLSDKESSLTTNAGRRHEVTLAFVGASEKVRLADFRLLNPRGIPSGSRPRNRHPPRASQSRSRRSRLISVGRLVPVSSDRQQVAENAIRNRLSREARK
jgi:hypothetical protein